MGVTKRYLQTSGLEQFVNQLWVVCRYYEIGGKAE